MVPLGSFVRDNINGMTGIATARATFLFGCVRIAITPTEIKEGKVEEGTWVDEQRVVVTDTPVQRRTAPDVDDGISLGDKVRDTLTGFEGMATARVKFLHNVDELVITPTKLVDGKIGAEAWLPAARISLLTQSKPEVSPNSSATSGGPQTDYRRTPMRMR